MNHQIHLHRQYLSGKENLLYRPNYIASKEVFGDPMLLGSL